MHKHYTSYRINMTADPPVTLRLFVTTQKTVFKMNSYEQFYIQLYSYSNKLIPKQNTGKRNPTIYSYITLVCDTQRNTNLSSFHFLQ
jgi:hypothetical protein